MNETDQKDSAPSIAEVLRALPDISGPEFDDVFDDVQRLRQHPVMKQLSDVQW